MYFQKLPPTHKQLPSFVEYDSIGIELIADYLDQDNSQKPIVIDFAQQNHSAINYFCQFPCVYIISTNFASNMLSNLDFADKNSNCKIDFNSYFSKLTEHKNSNPIGAILTWDYFNYFRREEIIKLMAFLSPMCRKGTRLFALTWLTDLIPSTPGLFEIQNPPKLSYQTTTTDTIATPNNSAPSLVSMMPSFQPLKIKATREGILEIVLEFNNLVEPPDLNMIPSQTLSAFHN